MTSTDQNDVSEEALKERSYLWMARVFGLLCVVTLITDLILFVAVQSLLPLVRVQPFFISTVDKDKQIIRIVRPDMNNPEEIFDFRKLQEAFVREYLVARLGVGSDLDELNRRWGPGGTMQWMNSDSIYKTFLETYALGFTKLAEEEGFTRDVSILNVRPIPRDDGRLIWNADVRLSDMSRSLSKPETADWTIELSVRFGELREGLTWEERLQNPLGFQINGYAQRKKEGGV